MRIIKQQLDERAHRWVSEAVGSHQTPLSAFLSDVGEIETGKCWTFAPDTLAKEEVHNFKGGALFPVRYASEGRSATLVESTGSYLAAELHTCQEGLLLAEDPTAHNEEAYVPDQLQKYSKRINNVGYLGIPLSNSKLSELEEAIYLCTVAWRFLAARFRERVTLEDLSHGKLSVGSLLGVYVGAYDGEGYVCWEPNG